MVDAWQRLADDVSPIASSHGLTSRRAEKLENASRDLAPLVAQDRGRVASVTFKDSRHPPPAGVARNCTPEASPTMRRKTLLHDRQLDHMNHRTNGFADRQFAFAMRSVGKRDRNFRHGRTALMHRDQNFFQRLNNHWLADLQPMPHAAHQRDSIASTRYNRETGSRKHRVANRFTMRLMIRRLQRPAAGLNHPPHSENQSRHRYHRFLAPMSG